MSPKRQNRLFQKLTLQHCRKIVFEVSIKERLNASMKKLGSILKPGRLEIRVNRIPRHENMLTES